MEEGRPDFEMGIGLGKTDTMFAFLEDVKGNRDLVFLAGFVETQAVCDGDRQVGGGVEEKGGRGARVDLLFVG